MGREPRSWTLSRDPRTGVYTVRFRLAGRRYHRSTGARGARAAAARAAALYRAAQEAVAREPARPGGELETLTAEWLADLRERRSAEWADTCNLYVSAHWLPRWSTLADVTSPAIARYIGERLRAPVSAPTVRKELSALRRFLLLAKQNGYLTELPTWDAPAGESDHEPICLSPDQVAALLAELPDHARHPKHLPVREFYVVMWATSLRHGTLARLRWEDVDLRGGAILVRSSADKRRYQRSVPLTPEAVEAIETLGPGVGLVFGDRDYRASLRAAAARAGIPEADRISDHVLRHSRITYWAGRSHNLAGIMAMAGHRELQTTQRYVHAAEDAARALLTETEPFRDTARDTGRRRKRGKRG